ncbi:DUF1064 domain-containing protein [Burkholderia singularis]|uniref:Uncharacterized protein n=1 Tax=Burkholderia singularis TaxID=1503053 RepID=A0A238H546_9BURK|nr:DUF1064 domain-containing protein [Burkholderia singularis]SMG00350.1 FIG00457827: hypothetical protein [Burkholderia singularis]
MTAAQRRIYEVTGNRPQIDSGFDEIADGFDPGAPIPLSMQKPTKPAKYRNTKCEHDGIKFDSEKERSRWFHLIQLQAAGMIADLQLQVPYVLTDRKQRDDGTWERASKYVADFVYVDAETGKQVVEDVKSTATRKNRAYIQKRKQMLDKYDISIKEV